ncbi:MAG: hypothetical protein U1E17_14765 [Geminicoccaceae bacterium]
MSAAASTIPKEMGFVDAGGFLFDTSRPGNLATGHDGPTTTKSWRATRWRRSMRSWNI